MFFISLSNNREYFSKQKFNRYLNHYPYPYLLISYLEILTRQAIINPN